MKKSTREKFINRLKDLIKEGQSLIEQEKYEPDIGGHYHKSVRDELTSWQVRVKNAIRLIFKKNSEHYTYLMSNTPEDLSDSRDVRRILGLLKGCLKDLEDGFIEGIEFIISD